MQAQLRKRKEGFTIIEVLIVLAIAGLILLVVFLAVPALQRNSRNTQRKNEVSSILGAVNEWANNNGGKLPSSTSTTEQTQAIANAKLSFYSGAVSWTTGNTNGTTTETVQVRVGAKCDGENSAAGSARQLVVMYTVEAGGGAQKLCQES